MRITNKRIYKAMKAMGIPSYFNHNYRGLVNIVKCEGKYEIRETESGLALFIDFLRLPFDMIRDGVGNAWEFFRTGCVHTYCIRITKEQAETLWKKARS